MSFTIKLYTNTSPENFLTKSITQVGTDLAGDLREESSIINPGIRIALASVPAAVNYMYVEDWGRYYFIDEIVSVRAGIWELRGRVDVLGSFATQIQACSGIVHRAESANAYNVYLDDGSFRSYADPAVITKAFPSGFTTWEYLLVVAGGAGSST